MDAKALAKSKRAHSQHHSKKHHPNQTPKAPSGGTVGTGTAKKPSGKQVRDQSRQSQGSSGLPSNWDRYEDEYDSGLEEQSSDSMNRMSDIILPKSKGSDYNYLISEAKSQSQTNMSSESFPALDDVLTDFNQGVGSLLSVQGQNLLSWMEDDNFVVEDKATASHEASFLSLNLHALAEQLAKVDISQRLFLEADLMPPELLVELQASTNQKSDLHQAKYGSEVAKKSCDEIAFHDSPVEDKNVNRYAELTLSDTTTSSDTLSLSDKEAKSLNWVKDSQSTVMSKSEFSVKSDAKQTKQQSRFEALAAEAELDMLLDSFGETKFLEPSGVSKKPSYTTSTSSLAGFPSVDSGQAEPLKNGPDLSASTAVGPNLGDDIDDLLNATLILKNQNRTSKPLEVMATASVAVGRNLGDDIDDLLNETLSLTNQNRTSKPHEVMATHLETQSSHFSHPVSKSKVLDDFDSWLDTI